MHGHLTLSSPVAGDVVVNHRHSQEPSCPLAPSEELKVSVRRSSYLDMIREKVSEISILLKRKKPTRDHQKTILTQVMFCVTNQLSKMTLWQNPKWSQYFRHVTTEASSSNRWSISIIRLSGKVGNEPTSFEPMWEVYEETKQTVTTTSSPSNYLLGCLRNQYVQLRWSLQPLYWRWSEPVDRLHLEE